MKYRVTDEHGKYSDKTVTLFDTEALTQTGRLAIVLLEKWGPVCAAPDGEDSAGRAKVRSMTAPETVRHAFDIAEEAWRVARERGLVVTLPDLNEINADADAKRAEKRKG